jgi:tetratricopeptide (TPR) repeat protein
MSQGNYLQAIQYSEAVLASSIEMDEKRIMLDAINILGWEAWAMKDYDKAVRQCEKAFALACEMRSQFALPTKYILGRVALSRGDYPSAYTNLKEWILALDLKDIPFWTIAANILPFRGFQVQYPTFEFIHALGVLAGAQHQALRAATLFGAQAALYDRQKRSLSPAEVNEYAQALTSTRVELNEKAFTAAWEEGQAMTLDEAVQYALGEIQK